MRPTASKMGLFHRCRWWARSEVQTAPKPQSQAAAEGTEYHKAIEQAILGHEHDGRFDVAGALQVVEDIKKNLGHWDFMTVEAPYMLTVKLGTVMKLEPSETKRQYPPGEHLIPGTADLVIVNMQDNMGAVVDWKTGHNYVDAAQDNDQLKFLAAMVARYWKLTSMFGYIYYTERQEIDMALWTRDVLEEYLEEVLELARTPGEPTPGVWCVTRYCPAMLQCPYMKELIHERQDSEDAAPQSSGEGA